MEDMVELQTSTDLEMGLGSLEGAYLAQKMKKKESIWDESVMDSSQYG